MINSLTPPNLVANADAVWLGMENPNNLMMVTGLIKFDDVIDHARFRQVLSERLLTEKRFTRRVVQSGLPLTPMLWEEDKNFNLDAHLKRIALPSPGDEATLQQLVSDLASTPLDQSKPLWQVHIVENYGEGSVLITRVHHTIADGLALVMMLLTLADFSPTPAPKPNITIEEEDPNPKKRKSVLSSLIEQATSAANVMSKVANQALKEGLDTARNPEKVKSLAQKGAEGAQAAGRVLRQSPDPKTIYKGSLTPTKKVAWSKAVSLSDVKTIKNALNSGVNEVLITAVSGALRRYMNDQGQFTNGKSIRAVMPMNLRSSKEMGKLGNKFGFVFVPLPVGTDGAGERLDMVTDHMAAMKESDETVATFGIQKGLEFTPHDIQAQLVKQFGGRATAVMSNIPGPPMPLYMAGSKVNELMFWMPHTGDLGLGVSMLSYAGKVFFGVAADASIVPNPQQIIDAIYDEIENLLHEATQPVEQAPVEKVEEEEIPVAADDDIDEHVEEDEVEDELIEMIDEVLETSDAISVLPEDLTVIKGVGPVMEQKLKDAGYLSVTAVAAADVETLSMAASISPSRAEKIIAAAKQ